MSKIEDLKAELQYSQDQYRIAKDNFELCKKHLEEAQIEFRIGEVESVLQGMRTLISLGAVDARKFDSYITHCLNCLYGNIDGIVISIDKDIEEAQESKKVVLNEYTKDSTNSYCGGVFNFTDPDTGVCYLIYKDKYGYGGMGGITVRYNPDGTIMVKEVE